MLIPIKYITQLLKKELPKLGTVLISYKCDNNCIFCAPSPKRNEKFGLTNEDIILWLRKCIEEKIFLVSISGAGEPLLNKSIFEFIELLTQNGIICFLYTSAQQINKNISKKLVQSGLKDVLVSIHGHNADVHDSHTGNKGSFNKSMIGLKNLQNDGFYVQTNSVITKGNIEYLDEMIDLLIVKNDVKEMALSYPEIRGNMHNNNNFILRFEEIKDSLYNAVISINNLNRPVTVENVPFCILPKSMYTQMPNVEIHYKDNTFDLIVKPNQKEKKINEACKMCVHKSSCPGIDINYPFEFCINKF